MKMRRVLVVLSWLAGISGLFAAQQKPLELTAADNGKTKSVKVGQAIVVTLKGKAGHPDCFWDYEDPSGRDREASVVPTGPLTYQLSDTGSACWAKYVAQQPGQTIIKLVRRQGGDEKPCGDTFTITFLVEADNAAKAEPSAVADATPGLFDPVKDAVPDKNPSGTWTYGYTDNKGTFTPFNFFGGKGVIPIEWISTDLKLGPQISISKRQFRDGEGLLFPPGQLCLTCCQVNVNPSTLRWTAPRNGNVILSGTLTNVPYSSVGRAVADPGVFPSVIDCQFVSGKDVLFTAKLNPRKMTADFNLRRAVKAGDVIDLQCAARKEDSCAALRMKITYQ